MNGETVRTIEFLHSVDGFTDYIHHTSLDLVSYRHRDRLSGRDDLHSALQSVGTVHGYGTHRIFSDVLLYFNDQCTAIFTHNCQRIVDTR